MLKADREKDQQEIGALENELAATTDDLEQVNKENTEVLYHIFANWLLLYQTQFFKGRATDNRALLRRSSTFTRPCIIMALVFEPSF